MHYAKGTDNYFELQSTYIPWYLFILYSVIYHSRTYTN